MMEIKKVLVKSKEEMVDKASDAVREYAHAIAMTKKGLTLQSDITAEEFDKALEKEMCKAWDEVKDLDLDGYIMRSLGEMLMHGVDPERVFGGEDGKEDC